MAKRGSARSVGGLQPFGSLWSNFIGHLVFAGERLARYVVTSIGPGPQIHQPAALAAEGAQGPEGLREGFPAGAAGELHGAIIDRLGVRPSVASGRGDAEGPPAALDLARIELTFYLPVV